MHSVLSGTVEGSSSLKFVRFGFGKVGCIAAIVVLITTLIATHSQPLRAAQTASAPVHITVGFQPYYSGAWGTLVVKEQQLWKTSL